jgi:carboxyl-terminal processing protease
MVILVDSQSASAAEMFARHFQRVKRAIVIGDKTSGAVVASKTFSEQLGAERVVPFAIQISTSKIMFPDNENLEAKGVQPDQMCVPTGEELRSNRDLCYTVAMHTLAKQLGINLPPPKAE